MLCTQGWLSLHGWALSHLSSVMTVILSVLVCQGHFVLLFCFLMCSWLYLSDLSTSQVVNCSFVPLPYRANEQRSNSLAPISLWQENYQVCLSWCLIDSCLFAFHLSVNFLAFSGNMFNLLLFSFDISVFKGLVDPVTFWIVWSLPSFLFSPGVTSGSGEFL